MQTSRDYWLFRINGEYHLCFTTKESSDICWPVPAGFEEDFNFGFTYDF